MPRRPKTLSLESAIATYSGKALPHPLPVAHMSLARWASEILGSRALAPRLCRVFDRELLYLFYGGAFYRPKQATSTRNVLEYPIAFLFAPSLLTRAESLFPFDTGAMASGHYGIHGKRLRNWRESLRVRGNDNIQTAPRLVECLYGTNSAYLEGAVIAPAEAARRGVQALTTLLGADLSAGDVDQRQCVVECHYTEPLPLREHLLWVGFPESARKSFWEGLVSQTYPEVPDFWSYPSHRIFRPREIAATLEDHASRVVKRYVQP